MISLKKLFALRVFDSINATVLKLFNLSNQWLEDKIEKVQYSAGLFILESIKCNQKLGAESRYYDGVVSFYKIR